MRSSLGSRDGISVRVYNVTLEIIAASFIYNDGATTRVLHGLATLYTTVNMLQ